MTRKASGRTLRKYHAIATTGGSLGVRPTCGGPVRGVSGPPRCHLGGPDRDRRIPSDGHGWPLNVVAVGAFDRLISTILTVRSPPKTGGCWAVRRCRAPLECIFGLGTRRP